MRCSDVQTTRLQGLVGRLHSLSGDRCDGCIRSNLLDLRKYLFVPSTCPRFKLGKCLISPVNLNYVRDAAALYHRWLFRTAPDFVDLSVESLSFRCSPEQLIP